ncbi:hypothetical protein QFZ34_001396 [Phyllobacterium ifriqiyense]|uniref:YnhF family membrane protein n=1 Tax=Phyllobacterium ifriqiyense TaxID=314238 RepID=A0ABU0S659_9HYPH|nr:hypothetical protein [Phyllobacterium ifriqiyense]
MTINDDLKLKFILTATTFLVGFVSLSIAMFSGQ